MGLALEKVEKKAPELLSLAKTAKKVVDASALKGRKARMALALDFSGSMHREYDNGSMQRLTEKVLALATQLDDDGQVDLFLFSTNAIYAGEVTLSNFRDIIDAETKNEVMGSTNYAALFEKVLEHYRLGGRGQKKAGMFGKLMGARDIGEGSHEPVLVVFLTDGAPDSESEARNMLKLASDQPVFWEFLSIGSQKIRFLTELDEMSGRTLDNANYSPVGDVDKVDPDKLFEIVLGEYPGWLDAAEDAGIVVHG